MQSLEVEVPVEVQDWLREKVADGSHPSLGAVVETLVAEHQLAELAISQDDHLWAKPQVDEAMRSLARGEGRSLDDVADRLLKRRSSL
jgi:hypothetical protein